MKCLFLAIRWLIELFHTFIRNTRSIANNLFNYMRNRFQQTDDTIENGFLSRILIDTQKIKRKHVLNRNHWTVKRVGAIVTGKQYRSASKQNLYMARRYILCVIRHTFMMASCILILSISIMGACNAYRRHRQFMVRLGAIVEWDYRVIGFKLVVVSLCFCI